MSRWGVGGRGDCVDWPASLLFFGYRYLIDSLRRTIFKNRMRNVAVFPKNESKCKKKGVKKKAQDNVENINKFLIHVHCIIKSLSPRLRSMMLGS